MNDQMAAILEAHREFVVRDFLDWLTLEVTDAIDGFQTEDIVQAYLTAVREKHAA
jgi:hypothetical protein